MADWLSVWLLEAGQPEWAHPRSSWPAQTWPQDSLRLGCQRGDASAQEFRREACGTRLTCC